MFKKIICLALVVLSACAAPEPQEPIVAQAIPTADFSNQALSTVEPAHAVPTAVPESYPEPEPTLPPTPYPNMTEPDAQSVIFEKTTWHFEGYFIGDSVTMPSNGETYNVRFESQVILGYSGCNDYFGRYTVEGSALTIDPLGLTKRACDEETGASELEFVRALESADSYQLTNNTLTIQYADGEMRFIAN